MAKRSKKVAFYLCVSTRHQDTPAGSLTSQKQRLFEWFKYNNSQVKFSDIMDRFFFDVGIMEWQDTEFRACPECKEISMRGFEPKE